MRKGNLAIGVPLKTWTFLSCLDSGNSQDMRKVGQWSDRTGENEREKTGGNLGRRVGLWCERVMWGVSQYSTHSMRETKSSVIYEKTKNVDAVRRLLGQSSVTATSAYLGVSDNSALELARSISV